MKIEILDLARDDLINGYHFYEKQDSGLGRYFLSILYTDVEALQYTGGTHPIVHRNFHRALSKRFP